MYEINDVDVNNIYEDADRRFYKSVEDELEIINDLYDSRKQVVAYLKTRYSRRVYDEQLFNTCIA
jgi:hypothetical protein